VKLSSEDAKNYAISVLEQIESILRVTEAEPVFLHEPNIRLAQLMTVHRLFMVLHTFAESPVAENLEDRNELREFTEKKLFVITKFLDVINQAITKAATTLRGVNADKSDESGDGGDS